MMIFAAEQVPHFPLFFAQFKLDFEAITPSLPFIFTGLGVTLQFTLISLFFGFI